MALAARPVVEGSRQELEIVTIQFLYGEAKIAPFWALQHSLQHVTLLTVPVRRKI